MNALKHLHTNTDKSLNYVVKLNNNFTFLEFQLDAPFRLSKNFVPAPRSKQSPKVDDECHVVGWGYTTTVSVKKLESAEMETLNFVSHSG